MTTEFYNEIAAGTLMIVRALIGIAFTVVIIPWLRKTVVPWLKEKRVYSLVSKFVQAAEKLAESGAIDKSTKKDYVIRLLTSKGIMVTNEIEAFIESAVEELDLALTEGFYEVVDEFSDDDLGDEDDTQLVRTIN